MKQPSPANIQLCRFADHLMSGIGVVAAGGGSALLYEEASRQHPATPLTWAVIVGFVVLMIVGARMIFRYVFLLRFAADLGVDPKSLRPTATR